MTFATVNFDVIGQIALGVYAVLLSLGGLMGYLKAGSKASLLAGLLSSVFVLLALVMSTASRSLGFWVGLLVCVLMTATFSARFANRRKFFPTGVLCLLSLAMVALLFYAIITHN